MKNALKQKRAHFIFQIKHTYRFPSAKIMFVTIQKYKRWFPNLKSIIKENETKTKTR